jgi:small subunit ribosomal protein S4e
MTLKINIETAKVVEFIKFDIGNIDMLTDGCKQRSHWCHPAPGEHKGSFDVIHVVDAADHQFATWMGNVFTIGQGTKPWITLPQGKRASSFLLWARPRSGLSKAAAS